LKGGKEQKEVELPSGCCEGKLLQKCEDTTKCRKGRCLRGKNKRKERKIKTKLHKREEEKNKKEN